MPEHTGLPGIAVMLTDGVTDGVTVMVALPVMLLLQVVNVFTAITV